MLSFLSPFHGWSPAAPYALVLVLAGLLCTLLAVFGWHRRAKPGGPQFTAMMAGAAVWALFNAFELLAPTLAGKVLWAKLEYLGIATLPLAWFLFARSYTGTRKRLGRGLLTVLILIPAVTLALVATNEFHRLVWSETSLSTFGSFPSLVLAHGPWFWVHVIYSYTLLALGSLLFIRTVSRYPLLYRKQVGLLMLATIAPWVGNALFIFHLLPAETVDPTPLAFTVAGLALALSMSRFRLFSLLPALLPTAQNQVLQRMNDGVLVFDVDGRVVIANPAVGRMLGQRASDLVGRPAVEILGEEVAILPAINDEESDKRFEITLGKEMSQRTYDVVSSAVGRRAGVDMGRLLVLRDITERKKAEAEYLKLLGAVQDERQRLVQLIDSITDEIWFADTQKRFTLANPAALREFGATSCDAVDVKEFARRTEVYRPDMSPRTVEEAPPLRALRGEVVRDLEEIVRTPASGELRYRLVNAAPVMGAAGGIIGSVSVVHDITERRRAEKALRRSENRYRTLFESANDMVTIHDFAGRILEANKEATERLDYSHDELLGMTVTDIRTPEAAVRLGAQMDRLHHEGRAVFETEHQRRDGSPLPVEVSSSLIDYGDAQAVLSIARDLTERKSAEKALRETEEQLRQSQKMEAIGQLAGGIAHDFNNLLTSVIGNTQLLLGVTSAQDLNRPLLEDVLDAANRAGGLTRQILAFSRRQVLEPKVLCLNDVLLRIRPLLGATLGEDIDIRLHLAPDVGALEVDPSQLEQVVMNLVVNARDAMPAGGSLTIETINAELDSHYQETHPWAQPGLYVLMSVSDTGIGMGEETKSRIFEPFFTTKGPGQGTGLGLSTVYGIVKQSRGNISVYSEPGQGSTFKVYLPRVGATPESGESEIPLGGSTPLGSETILVVEDEPSVLNLIRRVLSDAGYRVSEATSYEEALAVTRDWEQGPDLLLTDVVLPGPQGGRALAELMQERYSGLPVLFMSGYPQPAIVHAGRLDEGIQFLQKPFTPDVLIRKVSEVLDAGSREGKRISRPGASVPIQVVSYRGKGKSDG